MSEATTPTEETKAPSLPVLKKAESKAQQFPQPDPLAQLASDGQQHQVFCAIIEGFAAQGLLNTGSIKPEALKDLIRHAAGLSEAFQVAFNKQVNK